MQDRRGFSPDLARQELSIHKQPSWLVGWLAGKARWREGTEKKQRAKRAPQARPRPTRSAPRGGGGRGRTPRQADALCTKFHQPRKDGETMEDPPTPTLRVQARRGRAADEREWATKTKTENRRPATKRD